MLADNNAPVAQKCQDHRNVMAACVLLNLIRLLVFFSDSLYSLKDLL